MSDGGLAIGLEWIAVALNIAYVILAAKQKIICWLFGIVASLLSIFLFWSALLYAEAALYLFYVVAGFYGWWLWSRGADLKMELPIERWNVRAHLIAIMATSILALALGFALRYFTDAAMPMIDAFTTLFSFLATYLTTRKVLSNWLYWIVVDAVSVGLYFSRGFEVYAFQMLLFTAMAIYGYVNWKRAYQEQLSPRR